MDSTPKLLQIHRPKRRTIPERSEIIRLLIFDKNFLAYDLLKGYRSSQISHVDPDPIKM